MIVDACKYADCFQPQPCPVHRDLRTTKRETFYSSRPWRKFRHRYLGEHPWCVECQREGRTTWAVEIDHILPISRGGSRFDEANLAGLCKPHHSRKTRKDNGN